MKRVLGDKIDDEQLEAELNKYLNDYHVNIESAKRGIIRKYGGSDSSSFVTASSVVKKIADLSGTEQNVDVLAKVVYVESKNITVKGLNKTIVSGILGDETSTASFTLWEPGSVMLEKGSVYYFRNCYCKLWNERVQINLGNRGRVEPAPGVTLDVPDRTISLSAQECKIGDIREGMGNVTVTGQIVSTEARKITVRGEAKTVYSGLIADDTGKIQYSAWHDFELKVGETICAKNAYIRAWKGIPQLNMGDRCEVSRRVRHRGLRVHKEDHRGDSQDRRGTRHHTRGPRRRHEGRQRAHQEMPPVQQVDPQRGMHRARTGRRRA